LNALLTILEAHQDYVVKENVLEEDESDKDRAPEQGQTLFIQGSLVAFVDRLDDEFTKSLQNIDPHTTDYVDRLKDEVGLYTVIVRSNAYFTRLQMVDAVSRTTMRRLEHLYFKVSLIFHFNYNAHSRIVLQLAVDNYSSITMFFSPMLLSWLSRPPLLVSCPLVLPSPARTLPA